MIEEVKEKIDLWMKSKRKAKLAGIKITIRGNIAPDLRDAYADGMKDVFDVAVLFGQFKEACSLASEYQWAEQFREDKKKEILAIVEVTV